LSSEPGGAGPKYVEAALLDLVRRGDSGGPHDAGEGSAHTDAADAEVGELCEAEARAHHDDVERLGRYGSHHLGYGVGVPNARRVEAVGSGADFEAGFADDPEGVAQSVSLAIAAGVAGLSIEDRNVARSELYVNRRPKFDPRSASDAPGAGNADAVVV
jgi:hypothetical protein